MKRAFLFFIIFHFFGFYFVVRATANDRSLTILFSGDSRGEIENCHCPKEDFGGLERRAVYIDSVRKEKEILLLDVGDALPLFMPDLSEEKIRSIGEVTFKAMRLMQYDGMNIGESDLILGEGFLKEKESILNFDLISSNIIDKINQEPFFKPYIIKDMKNGLRVGVLGVVNERYIIRANLDIIKNKDSILKYLPEVKKNSDIVIVLGHLGLPYSLELATLIDGIDIILSGHWDTDTQEPIKVKDTIIMPTAYKSRRIGRLDLEVGETGGIASYTWQSTALDERYEGNKEIENLVKSIKVIEAEPPKEVRPQSTEAKTEIRPASQLKVYLFQSPDCKECIKISHTILPIIKEKYKDKIILEYLDTRNPDVYEQMLRFERLYNIKGGVVPEVFFARYALVGAKQIRLNLDKLLEKTLASKKTDMPSYPEPYQPAGSLIIERFKNFTPYTVALAGFLDGVNPCAFTTLVFFLSFLAFVGYRRREMVWAGSSFVLAIFITYFLIGLGIFRVLKSIAIFPSLSFVLNIIIAIFTFLLGILNMYDYYKFKKTKDPTSMILKLPQSIKAKIHAVIGSEFRERPPLKGPFLKLLLLGFSAGVLISILESVCTGQVYLPTIAFVTNMPHLRNLGFLYLIIYNLAFILPLLIVFSFVLFGTTSQQFASFVEKHIAAVKLSTAILFFVLGSILLIVR